VSPTVSESLLREALARLRQCGRGRYECVCWLTGPLAHPGILDQLLHPRHHASAGHYEIHGGWLNDTFLALAHTGRELRAQLHTHPREAYHSSIDDAYPAVRTPGFLSIVIPRFARDATNLTGAHIARVGEDGNWQSRPPAKALVIA
jgi:hypothetical protein